MKNTDPSVFCANYPYSVRMNNEVQAIDIEKIKRTYDFSESLICPVTGKSNVSTLISPSKTGFSVVGAYNVKPEGIPGHIEYTDRGLKISVLKDDGCVGAPLRTTIASFALPPDERLFWNLQVQFGSDIAGEEWVLTPSGVDPALIWQIKAPDLQPSLAMMVDTDDTDPTKLMLFFNIKTLNMIKVQRAGEIRGLSRHEPIDILMEAILDEREINGRGYWKARVNGKLVVDLTGPTLSYNATAPHQWYCGLYRYLTNGPAEMTRVTYWPFIKMMKI